MGSSLRVSRGLAKGSSGQPHLVAKPPIVRPLSLLRTADRPDAQVAVMPADRALETGAVLHRTEGSDPRGEFLLQLAKLGPECVPLALEPINLLTSFAGFDELGGELVSHLFHAELRPAHRDSELSAEQILVALDFDP